jgi:hypothetical protein
VRLRPGADLQARGGSEIRRLFAGPLLPSPLVRPGCCPCCRSRRLRVQAVHADDVGEAYRLAATDDARAAPTTWPPTRCSTPRRSAACSARGRRRPGPVVRAAADLQLARAAAADAAGLARHGHGGARHGTRRIRAELGWAAAPRGDAALLELLEGLRDRAGAATPPLDPGAGGPLRTGEVFTGVGGRTLRKGGALARRSRAGRGAAPARPADRAADGGAAGRPPSRPVQPAWTGVARA